MSTHCLLLASGTLLVVAMATEGKGEQPQPGMQVEQSLQVDAGKALEYLLYLPQDYEGDGEGEKQWPMMLFLHGRGESYGPLSLVAKWGPPRLVAQGEPLPYILVSPQVRGLRDPGAVYVVRQAGRVEAQPRIKSIPPAWWCPTAARES